MVQVRGVTYRVERVEPHHYAVIRLLDDAVMGSFRTLPGLRIAPRACDDELFAEVVKAALRFARTSGTLPSVPPPQTESAPAVVRTSSTVPPRPLPV